MMIPSQREILHFFSNRFRFNSDEVIELPLQERKDEFRMNVGNVAPGKRLIVRISYISELIQDSNAIVFSLPFLSGRLIVFDKMYVDEKLIF